jgi:hypothetical protein
MPPVGFGGVTPVTSKLGSQSSWIFENVGLLFDTGLVGLVTKISMESSCISVPNLNADVGGMLVCIDHYGVRNE